MLQPLRRRCRRARPGHVATRAGEQHERALDALAQAVLRVGLREQRLQDLLLAGAGGLAPRQFGHRGLLRAQLVAHAPLVVQQLKPLLQQLLLRGVQPVAGRTATLRRQRLAECLAAGTPQHALALLDFLEFAQAPDRLAEGLRRALAQRAALRRRRFGALQLFLQPGALRNDRLAPRLDLRQHLRQIGLVETKVRAHAFEFGLRPRDRFVQGRQPFARLAALLVALDHLELAGLRHQFRKFELHPRLLLPADDGRIGRLLAAQPQVGLGTAASAHGRFDRGIE